MNTENNININNVLNVNDVQIACSEVSGNALSKSISDPEKEKQFSPFSVGGIHTIQSHLVYSITKPRKIKTGIPELSNAIGGGYPVGGLTVIGGVPNVGKTTIAVQSAVKMSKEGVPSVFLSLDMSGYEIIDKVYSQLSYQEYGLISYSLQDISKKKFVVNNEENLNLLKKVSEVCRYFTVVDMYDKEKIAEIIGVLHAEEVEMSRNVQSGNTQNLKSTVIQRSFPKWSVAERRKTAAASDQAACCACAHSRYFTGGSPSGLRV